MVICELTLNHIFNIELSRISGNNLYNLFKYKKSENRLKPYIFISHILPGSYASNLEVFSTGDIITKINNNEINRLDQLQPLLSKEKNDIIIETQDLKNIILNIDKIIDNEPLLNDRFNYKSTKVFEDLLLLKNKNLNLNSDKNPIQVQIIKEDKKELKQTNDLDIQQTNDSDIQQTNDLDIQQIENTKENNSNLLPGLSDLLVYLPFIYLIVKN